MDARRRQNSRRGPAPLDSRQLAGAPRRGVVLTDPAGRAYISAFPEDGAGQVLDGSGQWVPATAGSGDVVGPASAVDDRIATFDGITGKLIQDGGATIAGVLATAAADADAEVAAHAADVDAHFGVKHSIELDAGDAQLENDQATPGADMVYGTDGSGVKGWKADSAGGTSGYYEPLTDGDLLDPELVFALGDVIMVHVP